MTPSDTLEPFTLREPPRRVLVVCLRRIGDVLTATPLLNSLRQAWPEARIDVLVPPATAPVLEGIEAIDTVRVEPRGGWGQRLAGLRRLWRQYDLAVVTQPGDRPHLYGLVAANRRVAVVPGAGEPGARWKRALSQGWCEVSLGREHAVTQALQLARVLGLPPHATVLTPRPAEGAAASGLATLLGPDWTASAWAVVHPSPMFRYKEWVDAGWAAVVGHLTRNRHLQVVLSGGPAATDRQAVARVMDSLDPATRPRVVDAAGRLTLAEMAELLRRARVFVGPDTSVTHLAAAAGVPTVALFGPTSPVAWGPWPVPAPRLDGPPWAMRSAEQQQGNVWLLQGQDPPGRTCVPCLREGCEGRLDSDSQCLQQLPAQRVIDAVDAALDRPRAPLSPSAPGAPAPSGGTRHSAASR